MKQYRVAPLDWAKTLARTCVTERFLVTVGLGGLLALALVVGVRTTADLDWPCDIDIYRDIADAQNIAQGNFGTDPFYAGERRWYNPLVPSLVAGISRLTSVPVNVVYTRSGAYINMLAPVAFFSLVASLLGGRSALAATAAFILIGRQTSPSWTSATYSPWLLAGNFAQVFSSILAYACLPWLSGQGAGGTSLRLGFSWGLPSLRTRHRRLLSAELSPCSWQVRR